MHIQETPPRKRHKDVSRTTFSERFRKTLYEKRPCNAPEKRFLDAAFEP